MQRYKLTVFADQKKNDESYEDLYKTWISRLDPWSTDPVIHNPLSANPTKWLNTLKQLVG